MAAVLLSVLTGCVVGPDYQTPETRVPDAWNQEATAGLAEGEARLQRWWEQFDDPLLNTYLHQAATNNLNLLVAVSRIEEAMALRGVARSEYFGSVEAVGSALATRFSEETTPQLPPGIDRETGYFDLGFQAAWEADLWGRIRRGVESADAELEATIESYRDLLVLLSARVASTYIEIRTLQKQIALTQNNVASQRDTLKLTENLYNAGLVPELDIHRARLNLAITESTLPDFQSALRQSINALAVLLGRPPGALDESLARPRDIPVTDAPVFVGLPAELLRQRPDIRRAERLIAAQNARIGVATSEWYPRFLLVGDLRLEALEAGNLFSGGSTTYGFGPQVRWNLFTGGRIRNQVDAAEARTRQAVRQYEQTVLEALQEVENSMVAFIQEKERNTFLEEAVTSAQRSVEQVQTLYKSGLTDFQNVLNMERDLFQQQNLKALNEGLIAQNTIRIYTALGGGWDFQPVETATAASLTSR